MTGTTASTDTARLAFLGLGNIGAGVALRLRDCGWALTVHNRTPKKAGPLVAAGAVFEADPAVAVRTADVVLASLADEAAVRDLVLGRAATSLRKGTVVVDCSTVSPAFSAEVTAELASRGVIRVEACLIGNPAQARDGELRILAAGDDAAIDTVGPVLAGIGTELVRLGDVGSAAAMKLVFNVLLGAQVASLAEAVNYGVHAGLDRDVVLDVVTRTTGFSSEVMRFRAGFMRQRQYEPAAFRSALMSKDLQFAIEHARAFGLAMPVVERTLDSYRAVVEQGDGDADAAVLIEHPVRANRY